jgi:NAD-dependent SIR2 family protein deacetylase
MRCIACNALLSDYEATRKSELTGEYVDLCNHCYVAVKSDIVTIEREDLATPENMEEDWEDIKDIKDWSINE